MLREVMPSDWTEIGALADAAVRHIAGAPRQGEWLENRRSFRGPRRHYVAVEQSRIVGYAGIEQQRGSTDTYRMFLVLAWLQEDSVAIADAMLARLLQDAAQSGASRVWLREYAGDTPFVGYLLSRGFEIEQEFVVDRMTVAVLGSAAPYGSIRASA
jgi:hypothetical protein